jgi:glycosyltransferase involved in cell wall biosynthesis
MKSISVALATYNGSRFIREQLKTLAAQTVFPLELVVTDDASTDDTVEIVRRFAESAPFPVRLEVNSENLGYKRNFLKCAELCAGDFIALCDQDDIWLPKKLEAVSRLIRDQTLLIFHNVEAFRGDQTLGNLYQIEDNDSYLPDGAKFFTFAPWGMSIVFSRSILAYADLHGASRNPDHIGITESHDQWLHFLAAVFDGVSYTGEVLARYRQHERNVVGWGRGSFLKNWARNIAASSQRTVSLLDCVRARVFAVQEIADRTNAAVLKSHYFTKLVEVEGVLSMRRDVYQCQSFLKRSQALYRLVRSGMYFSSGASGLSARGFLKDATVGLLLSQLLRDSRYN